MLWPEGGGDRTLRVRRADGTVDELGAVDVVLPILHGVHGEDGTVQGFFDTLGIPYAGGGVLDSALCMDKHFMKIVLQAAGVPVSPWVTVTRARWDARPGGRASGCRALGLPVVRQARARRIERRRLEGARRVRARRRARTRVRRRRQGADRDGDRRAARSRSRSSRGAAATAPRASLPGEIVLTTREFYDFEGKYLGGDGAEVVCPADLTDDEIARVQELGIRAFEAVDGRGLARVDFFLRGGRARRERAEHDAGLHADLDVPEVLDRVRHDLPASSSRS